MTPEGKVKLEIAAYLERVPGLWFTYSPMNKPSLGRRRSSKHEKRLLDLTGYWQVDGRAIFFTVEVKAPGGERAPHQEELVNQVLRDGGFACFAESAEELRAKMRLFHPRVP